MSDNDGRFNKVSWRLDVLRFQSLNQTLLSLFFFCTIMSCVCSSIITDIRRYNETCYTIHFFTPHFLCPILVS
jgi:hypothetical protein